MTLIQQQLQNVTSMLHFWSSCSIFHKPHSNATRKICKTSDPGDGVNGLKMQTSMDDAHIIRVVFNSLLCMFQKW